jgi:signal transduction histidine kinase
VVIPDDSARVRLLFELGCGFAARVRLDDLVPHVIAKCREVLDAEAAAVLLLDAATNELYFPYVDDEDAQVAQRLRSLRIAAGQGIAGATLRSGRPLRVDDVAGDARFFAGADRHSGFTTRNLLCTPLTARSGTIGVLQVLNRHGGDFDDDDLSFLEALAGSIAVAIENAQLYTRLERAAVELEQKVVERTHELQEKNAELEVTLQRLRDTQAQLVVQEKLASLGQLTAGIAHEIKNPLNFVNNFAQLSEELVEELRDMLAQPGDPRPAVDEILADLQTNVAKIHQHGKRADGIVRGMLQHARGAGAEPQLTDINALLAEHANLAYHGLRGQDATFNVTFDTAYDPAAGTVPVVAQDLSRVFLNIVNNACYAAHAKRAKLGDGFVARVSLRTVAHATHVEIRIRDNGDGIPAALRDKIFTPFFTTKPPGQGTGLGLSISHDIVVQQHRGGLRVESVEGEFTELVIELPRQALASGTSVER